MLVRVSGNMSVLIQLAEQSHDQIEAFPVFTPDERAPLLQEDYHFKNTVSRLSRKHTLDSKFIPDVPERPELRD